MTIREQIEKNIEEAKNYDQQYGVGNSGADTRYGRRVETRYSIMRNLASVQDKNIPATANAGVGTSAATGYASYSDAAKRVTDELETSSRLLEDYYNRMSSAQTTAQTERANRAQLENVQNAFFRRAIRNPTQAVYLTYMEGASEINDSQRREDEAKRQYEALANDPLGRMILDGYRRAWDDYSGFFDVENRGEGDDSFRIGSGESWDKWIGSLRDADTITPELENAGLRMEEAERRLASLQALSAPGSHTVPRDSMGAALYQQRLQEAQAAIPEAQKELEEAQREYERLQEELEFSQYIGWEKLRGNQDFGEKSAYVPSGTVETYEIPGYVSDSGIITPGNTGYEKNGVDINYEYINGNADAASVMSGRYGQPSEYLFGDGDYLSPMTPEETEKYYELSKTIGKEAAALEVGKMTPEEKELYNYIHATQGKEAADKYLQYLKTSLTERQRARQEREAGEFAKEHPVMSSIETLLTGPAKTVSYIGQALDYIDDGKIDENAAYNRFSYRNSAIRNEVSKKWGPVGSFLYQRGMSMGDFLMDTAISGGNEVLSLAIMGTGAAPDTVIEAKDRGLTDGQAFTLGTIAGAAEILTEKVSLDTLLNGTKWSKTAIGYFLANTLAEGSEEAASDVINWVADVLIAQDQSQWRRAIKAYIDQGMSETEAFNQAMTDKALEIGLDAAGGMLSGGIMSIPGAVGMSANAGRATQGVRYWDENTVRGLIDAGKAYGPGTSSYKLAESLEQQIEAGKEVSRKDVGYLINATVNTAAEADEKTEKRSENNITAEGTQAETPAGSATTTIPPAPMTTEEREVAVRERENALNIKAEELNARGNVTEQERAELLQEYEAIEREKEAVTREETREYNERVRAAKTLPTAEEVERRREAAGNLRELERSGRESGATEEQIGVARRIADATGRRIVFINEGRNAKRGHYTSGTIYVNAAYGNETSQIIAHELTHSIENSGSYEEFSRLVQQRIMDTGGDLDGMLREVRERYAASGVELNSKSGEDMKELVAEYVERELLTSPESISSLVRESRSLGRKILDLLDSLLAKITKRDAAKERAFIRRARDLYAQALQDTRSETDIEAALQQLREALAAGEITEEEFEQAYDALGIGIEEWGGGQNSIASTTRQEVAGRLRSMLNSGASVEEIRRYVNSVSDTGTRQSPAGTGTDRARQIVRAAHESNMSVDEYLRQNWDEYEVDGQLRPEARRALEMEGGRRQYSIGRTDDNRPVAIVEDNILSKMDTTTWDDEKKKQAKKAAKNALLTFKDGIQVNETKYKVNKTSRDEYTRSNDTERLYRANTDVFADKMRAAGNVGDIITATTSWARDGELKHPRTDNLVDFAHGTVLIQAGTNQYEADTVVGITDNGENVFYDVVDMEPTSFTIREGSSTAASGINAISAIQENPSNSRVPRSQGNVKTQFSIAQEDAGAQEGVQADIRETIPAKAKGYLERVERGLVNKVGTLMQVPRFAQREYLRDIVQEMSREYLTDGRVSQETRDRLFEEAYSRGVEVDREFYDQYKDLKKRLREKPITISDADKADVRGFSDFQEFRKAAFGTLRIVKEGATPVDTAYQELSDAYPDLFPENITHPGDQIVRMYEVGRSIEISEKTLDEALGPQAEEYKSWMRNDFEAAIGDAVVEMRTVKRYAEERERETTQEQTLTLDEVKELYPKARDARKNYEKVNARNLLTAEDQRQVGRLMRGDIELSDLKAERDNVRGITEVFEAKQEYEKYAAQIREWNDSRKAQLRDEADEYLYTANAWHDKSKGILYSRETMERNIRDIVKDQKLADRINKKYFTPVHEAAAKSTKLKNTMRDRVRALELSRKVAQGNKVSEAHAVQLLGEAMDNIDYLQKARHVKERDGKSLADWRAVVQELNETNPNMDWRKVEQAVEEFRKIYDELFEMMNDSRVKNGYEPVAYRKGYFPHFQPGEGDGVIALFGKALGISTDVTALPTTINGLTHTFRPGIQWFGNTLERTGFNTTYDAVEGFDKYIEGVADVIFQTENIQRLRALSSQMRYRTSDEGLRKQVDEVQADTSLREEDKQNRIEKIYEKGRFTLSNFVVELEEYTNLLANKKSRADRNMEQALGRNMYNLVKMLESRVAANMVAVNPGSWLTNFIPLTQGGAMLDRGTLLHGMWDTLKAATGKFNDDIVSSSVFLTNRRGSDPLVRTWQQKASATMSKPMEWIDNFTADSLVRARYRQNVQNRHMSEAAAMEEADNWVAGVMADRSKGSTPTLFNRSNPLTKLFTQFQLEVNNQLSYVYKDIPRGLKEKGLGALALALFKFALGAWLYDEVYEYFIGRRPALDPLGMLNDTVGDLTGWELPNMVSLGVGAVTGDMPSFETEKTGVGGAISNLSGNVAEELPFVGGLLGGGRLPISSALPDVGNLLKAATNSDWSAKKRWTTAVKELTNPLTYLVLPFGGGQMKKILQGVGSVIRGGSFTVDSEGRDIMQYPIYNDSTVGTAWNAFQGALFGKSSFPGAQRWVESGFKNYSAKATGAYQGLVAAGIRGRDADNIILALTGAEKTENMSKKQVQIDILRSSSIPEDLKIIPYYALIASNKDIEVIDELAGGDAAELVRVLMDMADADAKGDGAAAVKREVLFNSKLTDDEIVTVYERRIDSDSAMKLKAAQEYGISMKDYYAAAYGAEDRDGDGKISQDEKTWAIRAMNLTREQKAALWQIVTGSSSPNKNPFGAKIGQEVYDKLRPEKTGEAEETDEGEEEERSGPRWENGRLVLPKYGESRVLPRE